MHSFFVYGQKYDVKVFSANEGLFSGQVLDVEFTSDGYAWFGTAYGVIRSDGITFTRYGYNNGFGDEVINDLFIDSKHNFWIATSNTGVGLFKEDTLVYLPELSELANLDVNVISERENGTIWFGTSSYGVFIYNPITKDLENITVSNSKIPDNTVWDILISKENEVWLATHNGVGVLGSENQLLRTIDDTNGLNGTIAYHTFEADNGDMWVSSEYGVSIVKPNNTIKNISEINGVTLGYVFNVNQDKSGRIWIGTERNGLFWYSDTEKIHITKKNGLSSNFIYRLIEDNKGNMWVATDGNGVTIFRDTRFKIFDDRSSYKSREVYGAIKDSKGNLWFTNDEHLSQFKDGAFIHFPLPNGYAGLEFWEIEELPNGNLLFLSFDYSLFEFDGEKFSEFTLPNGESPLYKMDVLINNKGEIVLAGEGGINIYKETGVDSVILNNSSYWGNYVNVVYQDSRGTYWLGTEIGVVEYRDGKLTRYDKDDGVEGEGIYVIEEDAVGNIWLGTQKGITLIKVDDKDEITYKIETFKTDERSEMGTTFLEFDGYGGMWQGTFAGLNYFYLHDWDEEGNINELRFPFQNMGHGIEFNTASLTDNKGNLYFGTAENGVIQFSFNNLSNRVYQEAAPEPFITSISTNKNYIKNDSTQKLNTINYLDNNIEIHFGALDYKNPNRTHFKYKLEGFDNDFFEQMTNERSKRYTSLPSGEYTFIVYAKSPTSYWSKNPAKITFTIKNPFWYTWWFNVAIILIIAGISYTITKARMEVLERKKLSKMVDEKTKEISLALDEKEVLIKEIHHRVKNNLAVISGLLEMQSWSVDNEEAKKALKESKLRISAIAKIHENLYQNKNLGQIDFGSFLEELQSGVLGAMTDPNKDISLKIGVNTGLIKVDLAIPCGLIVNELVTNSFKHGFIGRDKGVIEVNFKEEKTGYLLTVYDDGVGIEDDILEVKHGSLGITLVKSLSQQLHATIEIENHNGSLFSISIPRSN